MSICRTLIPLPRCKCSTVVLASRHNFGNKGKNNDDEPTVHPTELKRILGQAKRMELDQISKLLVNKFCYHDNLKKYSKLAMCKDCLERFVSTSNHVIEHDYKSETQPNIMFSVGGKCTVCRTKFSARALNALVGEGSKPKNLDAEIAEWTEHIKTTIQFISFSKKLKRMLRGCKKQASRSHDLDQDETYGNMDTDDETMVIECVNAWLADSEEYNSDRCFSDYGDDDIAYSAYTNDDPSEKKRKTCVESGEGEIMEDLLKRDPIFRQEQEDLKFIKEMCKTAEGRQVLGLEEESDLAPTQVNSQNKEQIEQDAQIAREIAKKQDPIGRNRVVNKPLLQFFGSHVKNPRPKWKPLTLKYRFARKEKAKVGIKKFMVEKLQQSKDSTSPSAFDDKGKAEDLSADKHLQNKSRTSDNLNAAIEILDSDSESEGERRNENVKGPSASIARDKIEVLPSYKNSEPKQYPPSKICKDDDLDATIEILDSDSDSESADGRGLGSVLLESPSLPCSNEDTKPSSLMGNQESSSARPTESVGAATVRSKNNVDKETPNLELVQSRDCVDEIPKKLLGTNTISCIEGESDSKESNSGERIEVCNSDVDI